VCSWGCRVKRFLGVLFLAAGLAYPAASATPAGSPNLALLSQVGTALPASCMVGQLFFKSDATAGQNIYMCGSVNTWTQGSGGGGGGGGSMVYPGAGWAVSTGAAWDTSIIPGTGVATAAGNTLNAAGGLLGFSASFGQGLVTGNLFGDNYVGGETDASKWHFGYLDPSTAQTVVAALINPFSTGDKVHAYACHNVGMNSSGTFAGAQGTGKADDGTGSGYCTFWTDNGYRITLGFAAPGANTAITWNTSASEILNAVGNTLTVPTFVGALTGHASADVSLSATDQALTGGVRPTSYGVSPGNFTVDCGLGPVQYVTNGGAFTITAPIYAGQCTILITNNGSAGIITMTGWTTEGNHGDAFDTTIYHAFWLSVQAASNGSSVVASYSVKAAQ
jgi:hypothetical protein